MTIDEVIVQEKEMAKIFETKEFSEYHEQLAEWLEELKDLREMRDAIESNANTLEQNGYNKAIDDFLEKAIKVVYEANNRDRNQKPRDIVADIHYKLLEIAEQLKAGESE